MYTLVRPVRFETFKTNKIFFEKNNTIKNSKLIFYTYVISFFFAQSFFAQVSFWAVYFHEVLKFVNFFEILLELINRRMRGIYVVPFSFL